MNIDNLSKIDIQKNYHDLSQNERKNAVTQLGFQ